MGALSHALRSSGFEELHTEVYDEVYGASAGAPEAPRTFRPARRLCHNDLLSKDPTRVYLAGCGNRRM